MTDIPADEIEVKEPDYNSLDLDAVQSHLDRLKKERQQKGQSNMSTATIPKSEDVFGMGNDNGSGTVINDIQVKDPSDRYCTKTYTVKHKCTGHPIEFRDGEIQTQSQKEKAYSGAYLKWMAIRSGAHPELHLTEHEDSLVKELIEKAIWIKPIGMDDTQYIQGEHVKANLFDDVTSGGQNVVPEFFDTNVYSKVILASEILPFVDSTEMPRGSTVETATIGIPAATWNVADGTTATLVDATGLIAQVTANVFSLSVYIQYGNDFSSDSVTDIGSRLTGVIANRFASELDNQIINGDGTTEIQGVLVASGTIDVTPQNPTAGAITYSDHLSLTLDGISKVLDERKPSTRYVMTKTTYSRFKDIVTGVTGDSRPIFGMDVKKYMLSEESVSIETNMGNNNIIYGNFSLYRLWRRQGITFRFETGGSALTLANSTLLAARGRFAGKTIEPAGFAIIDSADIS